MRDWFGYDRVPALSIDLDAFVKETEQKISLSIVFFQVISNPNVLPLLLFAKGVLSELEFNIFYLKVGQPETVVVGERKHFTDGVSIYIVYVLLLHYYCYKVLSKKSILYSNKVCLESDWRAATDEISGSNAIRLFLYYEYCDKIYNINKMLRINTMRRLFSNIEPHLKFISSAGINSKRLTFNPTYFLPHLEFHNYMKLPSSMKGPETHTPSHLLSPKTELSALTPA